MSNKSKDSGATVTILDETADFSAMKPSKFSHKIPGCVLMSTSKGPSAQVKKVPVSEIGQAIDEIFGGRRVS